MFQYHPDIIAAFPNTVGGIIHARGMQNQASSDELKALFIAEQEKVIQDMGDTALSDLPSLAAWRRTFSAFGVSPTQYRSAPEALLRRLTKQGDIPSINTLVDIGNLISIRYQVPVAVFDNRHVTGMLTVRYADGTEHYTELGSDEIKHPEKAEVIFADETGLVYARRWCWRQSFQSAARLDTTEAIIAIEAQHEGAYPDIEKAVQEMQELLYNFAGGVYQAIVLNRDNFIFGA